MDIKILGNQISSDLQDLSNDVEQGLADSDHITSELGRITEKLKVWESKAEEIIDEADEPEYDPCAGL